MELISMVDFVLMQDGNLSQNDEDRWLKSHQYAEFLKQPLELWMFVPCDDDGNVLEEPYRYTAKRRCRFENENFVKL